MVVPSDTGAIPGVVDFSYDHYFVLGGDHVAAWTSDTDAYSWDHPNLVSANPSLGNQTGWTHLSRWIAVRVEVPTTLTIRFEATGGVLIPDQNVPGNFVTAGSDLIPAFTLWQGFEADREDASLGLGDPQGGHRFDNDGNETAWADQLSFVTHEANEGGALFVEATLALAAGDYTINLAGNKGDVFDPGTVAGDLRKGYSATLTTIPEPGVLLLVAIAAGAGLCRRSRRG